MFENSNKGKSGWGVIGIGPGSIAQRMAIPAILANDHRLVAVLTRNPANAQEMVKNFPNLQVFTNLEEFLRAGMDIVYIGSPPAAHFQQAMETINSGKHLIIEKPMALSLFEAREIIKLAQVKKMQLDVAHVLIYHPAFQVIKEQITQSVIGKIRCIDLNMLFNKIGSLKEWYLLPEQGGILRDMLTHVISILYFLFDDRCDFEIEKISAKSPPERNIEVDVDSQISGRINEIPFQTRMSWIASETEKTSELRIRGDRGYIALNMMDWSLDISGKLLSFLKQNLFQRQFSNFSDGIKGKPTMPIYQGAIGLRALEIIEDIYQNHLTRDVKELKISDPQDPRVRYINSVRN